MEMRLGEVRLRGIGQINSGFSWNTAPATNPGIYSQIPNTFGGLPAATPGAGMAPAGDCYTCTNPSTGDTQYGVPSAKASQLKSTGYRCRKDDCARPLTPGHVAPISDAAQGMIRGITNLFSGGTPAQDVTTYAPGGGYGALMGDQRRIPLAEGLGRRALQ